MTDATADAAGADEPPKKKPSKLPLIAGLVLAILGGGGGFYAAWSGLLPIGGGSDSAHPEEAEHAAEGHDPAATVAFLELPQLIASLGPGSAMQHLRFRASLEVDQAHLPEVTLLQPRILDVLNTYLRALEPQDVEAQGALIQLRSQMLRRIQLVTGEDRVRDLLVTEFVLN
ncbi:flagellar basal body-associated FliL family protein [Salipiger marinus]|uniref:Flagellar protein FliL n=1 Tax=Salipiger marinus TaxID=555512 RepID=A0A1G8I9P5_9RHOB|nr:flagellar basal body-associated FliL family protein [Salipiger marinus]SDI15593.1 flagellar FliL protein [Salipiger marinus]